MQAGESSSPSVDPEEPAPPPKVEKEPKEIRISIFFDGTGNNRGNIQKRKSNAPIYKDIQKQNPGEDKANYASFDADFSNIALLEEQFKATTECEIYKSFYIEGIATRDIEKVNKDYEREVKRRAEMNSRPRRRSKLAASPKVPVDSAIWGNGMAIGSTGMFMKTDAAFSKIRTWLQELIEEGKLDTQKHEITKFVIDVFGFSRGAATARHFIHHLLVGTRPKVQFNPPFPFSMSPPISKGIDQKQTLEEMLKLIGLSLQKHAIEIGFAGLFDTVSSYIIALTSDVKDLNLDAITHARKVYHLAAAEEHRLCFSLTNIKSAGGKGEEYFLPGVHSDVGGGYREFGEEIEDFDLMNNKTTTVTLYRMINRGGRTMDYQAFNHLIQAEGWYQGHNQIHIDYKDKFLMKDALALKVKRTQIGNTYRRIPLQLMAEAMESECFTFKGALKSKYKVPGELSSIEGRIRSYVGSTSNSKPLDWFTVLDPELKKLRNEHLHYSSRVALGHWPRFKNKKRYRHEYNG